MRIQDGKYDIISRKYGVSLGAEALSSPVILVSVHLLVVRLQDLSFSLLPRQLVYRVAAQQSGIPVRASLHPRVGRFSLCSSR